MWGERVEDLERQIWKIIRYGIGAVGFLLVVNTILFILTITNRGDRSTKGESKNPSPRTESQDDLMII
jgi:amino acid transporter